MPGPSPDRPDLASELSRVLSEAKRRGFLGPGPVADHVAHSLAFARCLDREPGQAVDLGSGGGVPGLVLALSWPASRWTLVEAAGRRQAFLAEAIQALGLGGRVSARPERAETTGRDPGLRGAGDLVVARSFGPPAVVAECAAPLLHVGGLLLVAEPPGGSPERWPAAELAQLGLVPDGAIAEPRAIQRLRLVAPCPDRFPRRPGIPLKRPLFTVDRPGSDRGGRSPPG